MRSKIIFFGIILVAIFLRFFLLSTVPPSATLDEATIGWNAYSILHTGKDEYGYFLPILLRAYDDYRPALYVYTVIPFVKILGLNVLAVRLPSVLMSLATVVMSYFLVLNIFPHLKKKKIIATVGMLFLAISPWHVYISRLGHEVNLGLTLIIASILCFFLFINKKNIWFLLLSFFGFAVSFYSYQSEKVFTPLILLVLCLLFLKDLLKVKKEFIIGILLFGIVTLPIFFASLSPAAMLRLKGTSVFTNNPAYTKSAENILNAKENHNIVGEIVNNRRVVTAEIFFSNYFSHFNPLWYFGNSGNEPFKAPSTGLLYLWEAPFLIIGLLYFFLTKEVEKKIKYFIIFWIISDFIAPGLTTGAPHAMRAYTLLPVPQIVVALGIIWSTECIQKFNKKIMISFVVFLSMIVAVSFVQFFSNYFLVFPKNQSESFQYALGNALHYTTQHKISPVIISNKDNLYQSYMFYLFYTKFDPVMYQKLGGTKSGGFNETHVIGNITFRPINWQKDYKINGVFIGNPYDFPHSVKPIITSYYLDGKPGVTIVEN